MKLQTNINLQFYCKEIENKKRKRHTADIKFCPQKKKIIPQAKISSPFRLTVAFRKEN